MKYPIGIQTFSEIREKGYVYVDKTDLVYSLAHEGKTYFLSRPRRFGKSLLVSTLEAYFSGKRELFKGLKIDALETEWKTYPILHVDFGKGNFVEEGTLEESLCGYVSQWEEQWGLKPRFKDISLRFADVIDGVYRQSGQRCVVLIDEYDKPLLDVMGVATKVCRPGSDEKVSLESYNREQLKAFYSVFKTTDASLQFVFLTGVTKFSQVSVFSGFNQPLDISMSPKFDTLCGITEQEMVDYFAEPISAMAEHFRCDFGNMVESLRKQYDGYHFSDRLIGVYNPFSLLNAFFNQRIEDYWFRTGTPTYLVRLLVRNNENLDELTGKYYRTSHFIDYRADKEMPLPMIYQSGYLTIKGYKMRNNTFLLDFPNDEVKRGFTALLANNYFKSSEDADCAVLSFSDALEDGNLEDFRIELTSFLASIPYSMRRKENEHEKERYFHYTFYLILRLLSTYMIYTEKQQSHGRVDCVIETDRFIYIFEFKLDGSAEDALNQIEEKGYAAEYAADSRKLYKIGVSFSSETGTVGDWKVVQIY